MVLTCDGAKIVASSVDSLFEAHPRLQLEAELLAQKKKRHVRPEGVLYARQKEFVVTHLGDRFDEGGGGAVMSCGTEDVLTCHVIVLHHAFTQVTALAHFDEFVQHQGLERFVNAFLNRVCDRHFEWESDISYNGGDKDAVTGSEWEYEWIDDNGDEESLNIHDIVDPVISLHMVGGYEDEAGKAARLSMRLIDFFADFHHSNLDFRLQTFCVGKCNTKRGRNGHNEPKIGGVVFQLKEPTLGPQPADLNRHFISSSLDADIVNTLLLGPSLIRKPFKLKKIIMQKEDEGYARRTA